MRRQPPTTWGRQECLVPQKAAGCPFGSWWSSSLRLPGISAHGWRSLLRRFKIVGIRCRPMIQRRTDRHRYRACAPFAVPRPQTSRLTFGPFCRSRSRRAEGRPGALIFFREWGRGSVAGCGFPVPRLGKGAPLLRGSFRAKGRRQRRRMACRRGTVQHRIRLRML